MDSFLDPHLITEVSVMYDRLARLQEKTPAELVLHQGAAISIYDCHPWLFHEVFPAAREEDVRTLSAAVRLFASSLMTTNPLFSLTANSAELSVSHMRLRMWQYQACLCLQPLFPPDAELWNKLSELLTDVAQAAKTEQTFISGEADWSTYRDSAYEIATKENGIGQLSVCALAQLTKVPAPAELLRSLNDVSFAVRMLADLRCWRQQLQNGIPSLLLSEMLEQAPPLDDAGALSLLAEQLEDRMQCSSSVRHVLLEAVAALDRAEDALRAMPYLGWRRVIEIYRGNCRAELESHSQAISKPRPATRAIALDHERAPRSIPEFGLKGLEMLLRECSAGLPEATHIMPFPRSQGFNNATEQQAGDVFQRALMLDVLCEANDKLDNQLSAIIAKEIETLLRRRRTTGIGGWSYFPHLRELPADADDLAQVMLAFLRSGHRNAISEYCEHPLSVLLSDNGNPDGSFETWIIPNDRDEELALQAKWVEAAWGTGADCEVNANLLYALWLYDGPRFQTVIERGTRYILACQKPDGSWQGTWYHGPFYATWMCLRLLESTSPDTHAIIKGREFLAARQNADGGWGETDVSDPLSTSFSLLGLATHRNGATPQSENIAAALQWLRQSQEHDGGWKACPFIKMELGRPTGNPWQTLTYQSRTVSTLAAVKAAFAWSSEQ